MLFSPRIALFFAFLAAAYAQRQCSTDNDCPGSEVCCNGMVTGEGPPPSSCIAQSSCVNGMCTTFANDAGTCDGG
ncbi:hypothetical protein K488DRAFT_91274 [Vararia minispora EC-137]|uniref:Uncharacterized protein n=1 Tax=Vararia minispora EC-137 TaxID=1314806 RepID=A0ACB8Q620_9AGAM|nr:hypothetical protein K488DRAFT_91274 [Vararia minispora EC-137]